MSETKPTAIELAEKKLLAAKVKLAQAKKKESQRNFKERTTALVTVGACWAHLLENDPDRAMAIWDRYLKDAAPRDYFKMGRRNAIKNQFGLEGPEVIDEQESRPPSAD